LFAAPATKELAQFGVKPQTEREITLATLPPGHMVFSKSLDYFRALWRKDLSTAERAEIAEIFLFFSAVSAISAVKA